MKKIFILALSLLLLAGCSTNDKTPTTTQTPTATPETTTPATDDAVIDRNTTDDGIVIVNGDKVDEQLELIAKELYAALPEKMDYVFYILDDASFESYTFVPYQEGIEGVSADPMITSIPHSLVLLKITDNDIDGKELAKQIEENADLNKWICVSADSKKAIYKDGYIMFVMSDKDTVDTFVKTFESMDLK